MGFWNKKGEELGGTPSTPSSTSASSALPRDGVTATVTSPSATGSGVVTSARAGSLSDPSDALQERFGKVRSALGPGTVISGKLSFDTVVSIDGKLSGEIFSSKALLIGKSGVVEAQIEAAVLIVRGVVKGTIKATERIEILSGGQILGDIATPVLVMEEGCVLSGSCAMESGQKVVAARSTDKAPERSVPREASTKGSEKIPSENASEASQAAAH